MIILNSRVGVLAKKSKPERSAWSARLPQLFLLLTLLTAYVPWVPSMPAGGVDPSWVLALDYATKHGLVFGRDVAFTYGPFHYLRTGMFNPLFDVRLLVLNVGIAAALWLGLFALTRLRRGSWTLLLCLALAATAGNDIRFLLVPLAYSLLCAKALFEESDALDLVAGAALLSAVSLLGLVKGTSLFWGVFAAGLAAIFSLCRRRWGWAAMSLAIPLAAVPLFWLCAGQPLAALPDYLATLWQISYGYNQAMHSLGDVKESILLLLMALATLYWIVRRAEPAFPWRVAYLTAAFTMYWFFAIKVSVVRHDAHATIGGHFALLVPLLLGMAGGGHRLGRLAAFGLLVCLTVDIHYGQNPLAALPGTYMQAAQGLKERVVNPQGLEKRRRAALRELAETAGLPRVAGRVDLYPDDCSRVIAMGLNWSPRPVFQSYSAYTPALEELNRRHLLGPKAPDTIFFNVEPIDRRYPTLADGVSWPTLLALYRPAGFAGDYAILARDPQASLDGALAPISEATGRVNEDIPVPPSPDPVFVAIDMEPTLLGRLANLVYKYNRLKFLVELEDGSRKEFRIIPIMARAGFVISPLVESGRAFAALYASGSGAPLRVRSLCIVSDPLFAWQWRPVIHLHFSSIRPDRARSSKGSGLRTMRSMDYIQAANQTVPSAAGDR